MALQPEILYVEDNAADVFLLKEAVRRLNDRVLLSSVSDGETALCLFKNGGARPCVVVIDLGLPRIDGAEVLKALKSNPELKNVPTAVFASEAARRTIRSGSHVPDIFLSKPGDLAGYDAIASQILALCHGTRATEAESPELSAT